MDYIYDIVLNFQEDYYEFYEWFACDKLINVKRIPIYRISSNDYLSIKYNDVTIDIISLSKQSKIFLLTNGIEVMGILINKYGKVLKRSSLLFEEADDILSDKDEIKKIHIKYKIDKKRFINYQTRALVKKQEYVSKYLKKIHNKKQEYLIKYLYYEIYLKEEENLDIIYNKLVELSKSNINKLYDSIKKVNLELGRK